MGSLVWWKIAPVRLVQRDIEHAGQAVVIRLDTRRGDLVQKTRLSQITSLRPPFPQVTMMLEMLPREIFEPEHRIFRDAVPQFCKNEIVPYHPQWEKDGVVSRDLWRKAGEH